MSDPKIVSRVQELAPVFLEGLNLRELREVLKAGTLRRFRAQSLIASETQKASKVSLLLEGRARHFATTPEEEKIVLKMLLPGEITGGIALVKKRIGYLVSTEAVVDSVLLLWNRSVILDLARRYPKLLENMLLIGAEYLIDYRDRHIAARLNNTAVRLAWVLDQLVAETGQGVGGRAELEISHEELANQASVTASTVGKLLGEWQRKGLLVKDRGRILVDSLEQLVRMVG
jgi:CRP-like cAMP-binding protein